MLLAWPEFNLPNRDTQASFLNPYEEAKPMMNPHPDQPFA
jgi:hypothetical protein